MRAPGIRLHKLALFGWAVVVTAVLLLLSLPVLAGACTKNFAVITYNINNLVFILFLVQSFISLFYLYMYNTHICVYKHNNNILLNKVGYLIISFIIIYSITTDLFYLAWRLFEFKPLLENAWDLSLNINANDSSQVTVDRPVSKWPAGSTQAISISSSAYLAARSMSGVLYKKE